MLENNTAKNSVQINNLEPVAGTCLKAVKFYKEQGFKPVLVKYKSKQPTEPEWQKGSLTWEYAEQRIGSEKCNLGLLLGDQSNGLVDIDIDDPDALRLADQFLPATGMVTGRASNPRSHWFYLVKDPGNSKKYVGPEDVGMLVEYRANGSQTVVPPSIHCDGEEITIFSESPPAQASSQALLDSTGKLAAAALLLKHWNKDKRHNIALALAGGLASAGWVEESAQSFIQKICSVANDEEQVDRLKAVATTFERAVESAEVTGWPTLCGLIGNKTANAVRKYLNANQEIEAPEKRSLVLSGSSPVLSDAQIKDLFVRTHGADLKYSPDRKAWMVWNGNYWQEDKNERPLGILEGFLKQLCAEVASSGSQGNNYKLVADLARAQTYERLRSLLALARKDLPFCETAADKQDKLLNCANGTIDLRTGLLREPARNDMLCRSLAIAYRADAKCPRFEKFISEITLGDAELASFLQRAFGYSLTGSLKEQCFFVLYGNGSNGKSTLLNLINKILGPYAQQAAMTTLVNQKRTNTNDLAELRGARFVPVSEAEQQDKFAEALIKQLTGGEPIRARHLYKNEIEFLPQCKFFIATNHKPQILGTDDGIWRRVKLIPFNASFSDSAKDPDLSEKLFAEAEGILAWLVSGCLDWQTKGLCPPTAVLSATKDYQEESDSVARFLSDMCQFGRTFDVLKMDLRLEYDNWCNANGIDPINKRSWPEILKLKGCESFRSDGKHKWRGVRLQCES